MNGRLVRSSGNRTAGGSRAPAQPSGDAPADRSGGAAGTSGRVRTLTPEDLPAARAVLDVDPTTNVFVDSRVRSAGLDPRRLGAEVWGYEEGGRLVSLCYAGANIVPVEASPKAVDGFAERALANRRRCSSIWGPREAVEPLWRRLEPTWGPARAVRGEQPFMVLDHAPEAPPDPAVRLVRLVEFDLLYAASVAFFVEELGICPETAGGDYRARVSSLLTAGHALARVDDGRIVFKAEIGVATPRAFQIQGVWVPPDWRGRGLAAPGTAAVAAEGFRQVAPVATLYVNGYNTPARRAYRAIGFEERSTFMTVLF